MSNLDWYEQVSDIISEDIESYYNAIFDNFEIKKVGNQIRIEPCPSCGHSGCCTANEGLFCFSCSWSGSHIGVAREFLKDIEGMTHREFVRKIEDFTGLPYPKLSDEDEKELVKKDRKQKILKIAQDFYHNNLISSKNTFFDKKTSKEYTPLEYLVDVRKRKLDTIHTFKIGFSERYWELLKSLEEAGYTKEEIKDAKIWTPNNVYVFFYKNHANEIVRINTKNSFNQRYENRKENGETEEGDVIEGFSTGEKAFLFSPKFSFKKPAILVEGEHDLFALHEKGVQNIGCMGGNISEQLIRSLRKAEKIIVFTDNDDAGIGYQKMINNILPANPMHFVEYPSKLKSKDPDEIVVNNEYDVHKMIESAKKIDTDSYIIENKYNEWTISNRHQKLVFKAKNINKNLLIVGSIDSYKNGSIVEKEEGVALIKSKTKLKPFNLVLSDYMAEYYNDIDDKDLKFYKQIYPLSHKKAEIVAKVAEHLHATYKTNTTRCLEAIKYSFEGMIGYEDFESEALRAVTSLQNEIIEKDNFVPSKIRISQYFNVLNNDAYFYVSKNVRDRDGSIRVLPCLLRNDKVTVRLDAIKRKDAQCMLLLDNKYQLPIEIPAAITEIQNCSLIWSHAKKYTDGDVDVADLSPAKLASQIESMIRRFYFAKDEDLYRVLTLYCIGTYYYELLGIYPYMHINGEKGSGKSVLDLVLKTFCFNAKVYVDMTEATIFRKVSIEGGTLILDEVENLTSRKKSNENSIGSILKAGYKKGAMVPRVNPDTKIVEDFEIYCPKIISNIFGLEDVVADRCIEINSYRQKTGIKLENVGTFIDANSDKIKEITSYCCLSALENFQKLYDIYNNCDVTLDFPRLTEIMKPLIAVAKLVDCYNGDDSYEKSMMAYCNDVMSSAKREADRHTPESNIKEILFAVSSELCRNTIKIDYTSGEGHKYNDPILFNHEEGWFEMNVVHFKVFLEELNPGDSFYTRMIPKLIKNVVNVREKDIGRKRIKLDDEDLAKDLRSSSPRVNNYRFYFSGFVASYESLLEQRMKEKGFVVTNT